MKYIARLPYYIGKMCIAHNISNIQNKKLESDDN